MQRCPIVLLASALTAAAVGGCGHGAGEHRASPPKQSAAQASPAARPAGPLRVSFRLAARLPAPVQLPAVAQSASGALVMGGLDQADASSAAIVRVAKQRAVRVGTLPAALHDAAAARVGGRVLFMGGGNAGSTSAAIDAVSGRGQVTRVGALPRAASDVAAASVGKYAYVVGGYDGANPLDTIVRVDASGRSRVVAHLPERVRYAAVTAVGGRLVVAGGTVGTAATGAVYSFNPASNRVARLGHLPRPTTHATAVTLAGEAFVLGGRSALLTGQRDTVVAIDPATGRTRSAGKLPHALSDLSALSMRDSAVVVGGRDPRGTVHREAWVARAYRSHAKTASTNVYAADRANAVAPVARRARRLVYVPNSQSNTVDEVSQRSGRIVRHFAVGALPQHVTPSWDLKTLYVTNDQGNTLTPIDPRTGRPGKPLQVTDPYNLYFTADGHSAIVVEEAHKVLAFRDPHTMKLQHAMSVPMCPGVDHMDYSADGRTAVVSCEFGGRVIVVDLARHRVRKTIALAKMAMPQDVKLSPDGRTFYVADMASNGVWLIDARHYRKLRFEHTGRGAHGLYPSRDARTLYVSNRGEGTISLIDFHSRRVRAKWHLPGGGSPDMGGVSADGKVLWLTGRYNGELYAISTRSGRLLRRIKVGQGPHGAAVWPQPGRYSIGHTGIMR